MPCLTDSPIKIINNEDDTTGVSVKKWKETRGRELMFGGQGKRETGELAREERRRRSEREQTGKLRGAGEKQSDEPQATARGSDAEAGSGDEPTVMCNLRETPAAADDESPLGRQATDSATDGLQPPRLPDGRVINGQLKKLWRRQAKHWQIQQQQQQQHSPAMSYWHRHEGATTHTNPAIQEQHPKGAMHPRGLALHHPAAATLLRYATQGCPVNTGKRWTRVEIEAAIAKGPHRSALVPAAME